MKTRSNTFTWIAVIIFSTVIIANIAYGDEGHGHHHDDGGDAISDASSLSTASSLSDATATGGTSTLHNNSKVLSVSGSGMEIRDCIATHALLFGLWQGTHVNKPCIAARMNLAGRWQQAAELQCSMWSFKRAYGRGQKCIDAIIWTTPIAYDSPPPEDDDEDDERYEALYARLSEMEAERVQDKAMAQKAAKRANLTVQRAINEKKQEDEVLRQLLEDLKQ